jgi:hypothetical protein
MYASFSQKIFVIGAVVGLGVLLLAFPVHAQTAQKDVTLVSCVPNLPIIKGNTFSVNKGDVAVFNCILKNDGNINVVVLMSGERVRANESNRPTATTSVAFSVEVSKNSTAEVTVPFTALFENGTYHYTITLKDISDGKSFGAPLNFSSTLGAETIRIVGAVFDKENYNSEDAGFITVTVATSSQGTKSVKGEYFLLDIIAKNSEGRECARVASNIQIENKEQSVDFSLFTTPDGCASAVLGIIAKAKDGFIQDSLDITVPVRGQNQLTSIIDFVTANPILVLFVGILILVALSLMFRSLYLNRSKNTIV